MAISKIINSFKLVAADFGKFLKLDTNGDLSPVNINVKYIKLTGHNTLDLSQSSANTYDYAISDFIGTNLDTDRISGFHIKVQLSGYYGISGLYAKLDTDSTYTLLCSTDSGDDNRPGILNTTVFIPISSNQTTISLKLTNSHGSVSFNILGVTQLSII